MYDALFCRVVGEGDPCLSFGRTLRNFDYLGGS